MSDTAKTFTCSWCEKTFEYEWSDDEAQSELAATFVEVPVSDCNVVCDDCYQWLLS